MGSWLDTERERDEWEEQEARREEIAAEERDTDRLLPLGPAASTEGGRDGD